MFGTWVAASNLPPVLDILGRMCGARLDADDLLGIRTAMRDTNDEDDRWHQYDLVGAYTISLRLARDAEEDLIHIRASAPPEHEPKVIVVLEVANAFNLVGPTSFFGSQK